MSNLNFIFRIEKKIPTFVLVTLALFFSLPVFSQRAFSLRTTAFNIRGDVAIVGNRLVGGSSAIKDNNACTISYIDLDGDATTASSSSADLTLPTGSTVEWAGLYWAGRSVNGNRNTIKFKIAGDVYTTYTATQLDNGNTISGITAENHYQGFVDVTNYVQLNGAGTYWGSNVYSTVGNGATDPYGTGYYAGWAMIVVYTDDTQPYRNITVFDGYSSVWGGNGTGTVTVPISGFLTPSSGAFSTKLGVVAWEGDMNITGDKFRLNVNDDAHNISDANNPATNFFNGTITNAPRNPNTTQNWGVDFDYITSNISLPLNSTSTNIYFNTSGDFYLPGAVVFSVELNPVFLPVELLSFNSFRKDNTVVLDWATASESNNDYFQIERSINTVDWQAAGKEAGQGNSNSYHFYQWEDITASEFVKTTSPPALSIYYRLKQVDFNGKFAYSGIRSVPFKDDDGLFNFSVYPNPASGNAKINFSAAADSAIEVKMMDCNGKIVFDTHLSHNNFNDFDLKHLKSGIYFIEARDAICYVRKRFVVE